MVDASKINLDVPRLRLGIVGGGSGAFIGLSILQGHACTTDMN